MRFHGGPLPAALALALAPVVCLVGVGCGKAPGVAVSGTVSYQGKPIEDGLIQFVPTGGTQGPTAGSDIKAGAYRIEAASGPVPGKYRVEISSFREVKKATQKELNGALFGRTPEEAKAPLEPQIVRENAIPAKYNANSELAETVPDKGSHTASFELK